MAKKQSKSSPVPISTDSRLKPDNVHNWVQTVLAFIAVGAAVWIGVVQNRIGNIQNQINQRMLDYNYEISLMATYLNETKTMMLSNNGKSNIIIDHYIVGGVQPKNFPKSTLVPGSSTYLTANPINEKIEEIVKLIENSFSRAQYDSVINLQGEIQFDVFVVGADQKKYICKNDITIRYQYFDLHSHKKFNYKNLQVFVHQGLLIEEDW